MNDVLKKKYGPIVGGLFWEVVITIPVALILLGDGAFENGPFKVTLYTCDGLPRTWIVKKKPEINGFGGGFKFKTEDGDSVIVSGNIAIEKVK